MFSNVLISLIAAASFSAWVYAKMQRQTGGNTQSSLTVAAVGGGVAFLALVIILSVILH